MQVLSLIILFAFQAEKLFTFVETKPARKHGNRKKTSVLQ